MDDNYITQDTSTYTDVFDSKSYNNIDLSHTNDNEISNDLSSTREKDSASSSEQINSQTNIFCSIDNNESTDDNTKLHNSESQKTILNEIEKNLSRVLYDSEHSNIQNDDYLLNLNQENTIKNDHESEDNSFCLSDKSMTCLDVCCTCFCL